jgi:hypothetical protein
MKPKPLDKKLYQRAKEMADEVYNRPSAYKSGYIVKTYKKLGGRYSGDRKKGSLARWYREEWADVNPDKTEDSYPVYRPTKRISRNTPLSADEVNIDDLYAQSALKQIYREKIKLPPFRKKTKSKKKKSKKKSKTKTK